MTPNTAEGAKQIGLAAEQGLLEAQIDYATLLYLGEGVPRDLNAAVGWYQRAANAGNPPERLIADGTLLALARRRYVKAPPNASKSDRRSHNLQLRAFRGAAIAATLTRRRRDGGRSRPARTVAGDRRTCRLLRAEVRH